MGFLDCGGWISPGWVKFYIYTRVSQQLSGGLSPVPAGGGSEALTRYWWIVPVNSPHSQLLLLTCPDWLIHPFIRSMNQITSSLPHCGENEAEPNQQSSLFPLPPLITWSTFSANTLTHTHVHACSDCELNTINVACADNHDGDGQVSNPQLQDESRDDLSFQTASFIQPVSRHFRNEFTQTTSPIPIDCINLVFDKTYCAVNKCVCMSRMLNTKL